MYINNITKEESTYASLKKTNPNLPKNGTEILLNEWYFIHRDNLSFPIYDVNTEKVIKEDPEKIGSIYYYRNSAMSLSSDELEIIFQRAKEDKTQKIREAFLDASKRPQVDSTLGYSIDGGYQDLQNFQSAKALGATEIRDAMNVTQTVTNSDLELIILKIQENGILMYQQKWNLEVQIDQAVILDDLELIQWR